MTDRTDQFVNRHLGPDQTQVARMLETLGCSSLDELVSDAVPEGIRNDAMPGVPEEGLSEPRLLEELRRIARENEVFRSYLGMGYHDTVVPR
jgi:glycine dehydrogenase